MRFLFHSYLFSLGRNMCQVLGHSVKVCILIFSLLSVFLSSPQLIAANVRISGLTSITNAQALSALTPRLVFINERPATSARADDAAFLLKQLLRNQGLPAANVSWEIPNAQTIQLHVQEGPLRHLGNLSIQGLENEQDEEAVQDYFFTPPQGSPLLSNGSLPYLEGALQKAKKNSTDYLYSQGYWRARVEASEVPNPVDLSLVDLDVIIQLGPQFTIGAPLIKGSFPIRSASLNQRINELIGEPANTKNIILLKELIEHSLYESGYHLAQITTSQTLIDSLFILTMDIRPGRRYRLGSIDIQGQKRTKKHQLQSIVSPLLNQPYDRLTVKDYQRKLLATGAFDSVRLTDTPQDDDTIHLDLELLEGRARGVAGYLGLGSQEHLIFGASFYDRNFLGNLWNLTLDTEYSGLGTLGQIRLINPWFLKNTYSLSTRAWLLTRSYDGYSKLEAGIEASLARTINRHYKFQLYTNSAWVQTSPEGLPLSLLGSEDYFVYRLGLKQVFDYRNSRVLPNQGLYFGLDTEVGIVQGDQPLTFLKLDARASAYHSFSEQSHLAFRAHTGYLLSEGSANTFPIDLRYFLGGANTIRSFSYRDLGPKLNDYPTGGEAYWSLSTEYIHQLKGSLNGLLFFDMGQLYQDLKSLHSPYYAIGLGLRFNLPVGPARLEYGYNLNPEDNDPSGAFHFSVGLAF